MPFAKRSTYTLTLAISAALVSGYSCAGTAPSEAEMAWNCSMTKDGGWDCDVNEELINEAEQKPSNKPPKMASQPAKQGAIQDIADTRTPETMESATTAKKVSIQPAPTAQTTAISSIRSTPTQERTHTSVAAHSSNNGTWDCVAGPNEEWLCNGEGRATESIAQPQAVKPSQPHSYAASSQHPISSQPIATNEIIGSEWQCGTSASGDWDCSKVNIHALTVPTHSSAQASTQAAPSYITENPYSHLDWAYYREQDLQQCAGRYLEPEFPVHGDEKLESPPLYVEADQSATILGGLSTLQGNVQLRQGSRRLASTSAELDQVTNKARFEGNVQFREPGLLMLSDSAQLDTTTKEAIFNDAQYILHEDGLRGKADRAIRLEDKRIRLENGDYTYCPPYSDAWKLNADNIVLNKEEGFGEAEDAVLRIAGVPVFYTPYFTFPIDDKRRSGFLYPSIGYNEDSGLDLAIPYYFNIAPNIDDTLTPRIISDRGLLLENELRYLNSWSHSTLSTALLPSDDIKNDDRWLLGLEHKGEFYQNWRSDISYTSVSDVDYFKDLDTNLEVSRQDHLDQRADLSYKTNGWRARMRIHDYQTIDSNSKAPYERLPQLTLDGEKHIKENLNFTYHTEYTRFDRNLSALSGRDRIIGDRLFLQPTLNYKWFAPWGYFKPELSIWSNTYSLENQLPGLNSSPNIHIPIASFDSKLIFERELSNRSIQTLEPRLFALYVPEANQDDMPDFDTSNLSFNYNALFRKNRFSGSDRIGDEKKVSLGINSKLYTETGFYKAGFSIGQAYYFADRTVQLTSTAADATDSQSDIATKATWNFSRNYSAYFDAILDHSSFNLTKTNSRLRYNSDANHRFDLSYRYQENKREQTDLSFIWPLANKWTGMGRWLYDIEDSDSLETALGLEYESCCWKVSFAGRRWLDDTDKFDTGVFLNFTLKGLGSFGSGSSEFLNDIIGYEEREEQNDN